MKVAIYNGFSFHYELFGYILEYCRSRSYEFSIYTNPIPKDMGWIEYYNISVESIYKFNVRTFDIVFLLTDDDYSLSDDVIIENEEKIVCIDHHKIIRRMAPLIHISLRDYGDRDYAMPIHSIVSYDEKIREITDSKGILVSLIGGNVPKSSDQLRNLITNYKDIKFCCMARKENFDRNGIYRSDNVSCIPDVDTKVMLSILRRSDYVLCIDDNKDHIDVSLSASIPLAYSTGCRLILKNSMKHSLGLKSCIGYDESESFTINKPSTSDIEYIYKEKNDILSHTYTTLDKVVKGIIHYKDDD